MPIGIDTKGTRRKFTSYIKMLAGNIGTGCSGSTKPTLIGNIVTTFPTTLTPGQSYTGTISGVNADKESVVYKIKPITTGFNVTFSKTEGIQPGDVITITSDGAITTGTKFSFEIEANSVPTAATNGPLVKTFEFNFVKNNTAPDASSITWSLAGSTKFEETKNFPFTISGGTDADGDGLTYTIASTNNNVTFSKTSGIGINESVVMQTKTVAGSSDVISIRAVDTKGLMSGNAKTYSFDIVAKTVNNTAPSAASVTWDGLAQYDENATYTVQFTGGSDTESTSGMTYSISNISPANLATFSKTVGISKVEPITMTLSSVTADTNLSFDVKCIDSDGLVSTDKKTFTVLVKDKAIANQPPTSDSITTTIPSQVNEGATATFTISGGTDPEGGAIKYRLESNKPTVITFSKNSAISANEEITLTAGDINVDTVVEISIFAVDNGGVSSLTPKKVTTTVKWSNAAPVMTAFKTSLLPSTVQESSTQNVLFTGAVDPEAAGAIKYYVTNIASQLTFAKTLDINEGETIAITVGAVTADTPVSFDVYAKDVNGAVSEMKTVNLTISNNNSAPNSSGLNWNGSTAINSAASANVHFYGATDPDGDTLTYSITGITGPISFSKNTGIAAYESISLTAGSVTSAQTASFNVTATDAKGLTATPKAFSIAVNPVNRAPVADNISWTGGSSIDGSTTKSVQFSGASDPDGDTLVYSISNIQGPISFSKTSGISANESIVLTANSVSSTQSASFSVNVTDPKGLSGAYAKSFNLSVTYVNKAPVTSGITMSGPTSVNSGASSSVQFYGATDPDGDNVTYSISNVSGPITFSKTSGITAYESITISGGSVSSNQTASFNVNATDSKGLSGTAKSFSYTVNFVNKAPVTSGITWTGPSSLDGGKSASVMFYGATDPDGDQLTYNITGINGQLTFSKTTGITAYESITVYAGTVTSTSQASFSVNATDPKGLSGTAKSFNVTVNFVNRAPDSSSFTWNGGNSFQGTTSQSVYFYGATDPDGDTVTYSISGVYGPIAFSQMSNIGNYSPVTFTTQNGSSTQYGGFTVTPYDSKGLAGSPKNFNVTVQYVAPPNNPPSISGMYWQWNSSPLYESRSHSFHFRGGSDPDGDSYTMSISGINAPAGTTFSKTSGISPGEEIYVNFGAISGSSDITVSYTVTATDSRGATTSRTYSETLRKKPNTAPTGSVEWYWTNPSAPIYANRSREVFLAGSFDAEDDIIYHDLYNVVVPAGTTFSRGYTGIRNGFEFTIFFGPISASSMTVSSWTKTYDARGAVGPSKSHSTIIYKI